MSIGTKILTAASLLSFTMMGPLNVFAKNTPFHKKNVKKHFLLQPMTLGFQSGRELLFNSSPLVHSKQSKVHTAVSSRLVLRKPLNAHFKVETGLTYSAFNTQSTANFGYKKAGKVSLPVNYAILLPSKKM